MSQHGLTATADNVIERQERQRAHFNQLPELRKIKIDQFSSPEYGPWNPYWYVYDLVRRNFRHPDQRLLSFGCGRGANALRYARVGYDVHAFDISSASIATAIKLAEHYELSGRTHFSVQEAETLNYPDAYFDVIAGENVLHHVDIPRALEQTYRVLKPGGLAIFKEPFVTPIRDRFRYSTAVQWVLPAGVKNVRRKGRHGQYHNPPDTVHLTEQHVAMFRTVFGEVDVVRFRLLAVFNAFSRSRTFLEKCDWMLFRALPATRRYGDMGVIVARKTK